jgi:hypothetical protein
MVNDPVNSNTHNLAISAAAMASIGTGMLSGNRFMMMLGAMMVAMILIGAKLILIARWKWLDNLEDESGWLRRLIIAAIAVVPMTVFMKTVFMNVMMEKGGTWLALAFGFAFTDWWKLTATNREKRVAGSRLWAPAWSAHRGGDFNGQEAMPPILAALVCGSDSSPR